MKHLKLPGFCLLYMLLLCCYASAQNQVPVNEPDYNKPKLFASLPNQIPVALNELKSFISSTEETGGTIQLKSSDNKTAFSGKIVSKATKYENSITSVVIRLDNFGGATLSLSASKQPDGTVLYSGRILSLKHGDLYELKKQGEQYFLIKRNFYELVNE